MTTQRTRGSTWEDSVVGALVELGGSANLRAIYAEIERVRLQRGLPFSATWKATVRRTLQQSLQCAQSEHRSGVWQLAEIKEV